MAAHAQSQLSHLLDVLNVTQMSDRWQVTSLQFVANLRDGVKAGHTSTEGLVSPLQYQVTPYKLVLKQEEKCNL